MSSQAVGRGANGADRMARISNEASSPLLANPAVSLAVGASTGSWGWTAALVVFTGLLPAAVILGGLWLNRISDHHVTDRDERPLIMAAILGSLLAGLAVCGLGGAPGPIIGVDVAMLATLGVLTAITVCLRWKVSVHSAVWAGIAGMLTLTFGAWGLLAFLIVPVVMWGRVHARDHTAAQVLVGALLGGLVASSSLAPFS